GRGAVIGDVRDGIDGDVDGRGLGHTTRGHSVRVTVGTVVVGIRRVGDGSVTIVDDAAMRTLSHAGDDSSGVLERVVREDVGRDGRIFIRGVAVVRDIGDGIDGHI